MAASPAAAILSTGTNSGVYVLECNDPGYYYVGASEHLQDRLAAHQSGGGASQWVRAHGGVLRVHVPMEPRNSSLDLWEQAETVNRMLIHGFDRVRGWEFWRTSRLNHFELVTLKVLTF